MGLQFNADEIFEIAEMIERNGAEFYRRAAELVTETSAKTLLLELAAWEESHLSLFMEMRQQLAGRACEPATFDPEGLTGAYLKALADRRVFDYKEDVAKKLSGRENLDDILKTAIGLEKDSIIFYLGLKELVPEALGKDKIEAIIKEEMRHIALLSQKLTSLES
jgi:rubrerythrin